MNQAANLDQDSSDDDHQASKHLSSAHREAQELMQTSSKFQPGFGGMGDDDDSNEFKPSTARDGRREDTYD